MGTTRTADHPWSGTMDNSLAQQDEIMFERNVALIASKRQEVQIYSDSFVYEGFLCGLDNKWLQIYGHEENNKNVPGSQWRFILVGKDKISAIGPTGRYVDDIGGEVQEWVHKKTETFAGVCKKFLESHRGVRNDNSRKEKY